MVKPRSQLARILHVLKDGKWHSTADIRRKAGESAVINSRISELRKKHSYKIEHRFVTGKERPALAHQYRLVKDDDTPPLPDLVDDLLSAVRSRTILDRDSIPRDEEHRYRVYRLWHGELELVATYPTPAAFGEGLLLLGMKGEFAPEDPGAQKVGIGVLDTYAIPKDGQGKGQGTWILGTWDTEVLA